MQHVFLDLWELSQHRSDVCHFRDPLHQPHLSQRNRDLETDLQAEGDHRRAFPVWEPDSPDSGIRPGGVWDAAAWPGTGGLGRWERLISGVKVSFSEIETVCHQLWKTQLVT